MLQLPNYADSSLEVRILKELQAHPQTDYFLSLDFSQKGEAFPTTLLEFITKKVEQHKGCPSCFRAVFKQGAWRLIVTFIPLHQPLDPKFYFVHKFVKLCQQEG